MKTFLQFMFIASMFCAPVMANDNASAALTADAMEQIEKEVMARLEEEAGRLSSDSKLAKAMKTNAAKKKLAAEIVAAVLAVGGVLALIYWLCKNKAEESAGGAQDPNNHGGSCSCGHHARDNFSPAQARSELDAIRHDVQALILQRQQDVADQLLKKGVPSAEPVRKNVPTQSTVRVTRASAQKYGIPLHPGLDCGGSDSE